MDKYGDQMTSHSFPDRQGLYDPAKEHDACGVGFVVNIKNRKSHQIVRQGLEILLNLDHRGAVGADPMAGDGAGIVIQIPDRLFRDEAQRLDIVLPEAGRYGVGILFLPQAAAVRSSVEAIVMASVAEEGLAFLGWRDVPVDSAILGASVRASEPVIRQVFVGFGPGTVDQAAFERKLFVLRKVITHRVAETFGQAAKDFYVPSLSSRTLVYKGMLLAEQVGSYITRTSPTRAWFRPWPWCISGFPPTPSPTGASPIRSA